MNPSLLVTGVFLDISVMFEKRGANLQISQPTFLVDINNIYGNPSSSKKLIHQCKTNKSKKGFRIIKKLLNILSQKIVLISIILF